MYHNRFTDFTPIPVQPMIDGVGMTEEELNVYPQKTLCQTMATTFKGKQRGVYAFLRFITTNDPGAIMNSDVFHHDCLLPLATVLKNSGIGTVHLRREALEEGNTGHELGIFIPFESIKTRRSFEKFLNKGFVAAVEKAVVQTRKLVGA